MRIIPVIMAGGSGTRFWPLSRKARPKQFLPLATTRSLITETAARLTGLAKPSDLLVVCGKLHAPAVSKLVKGIPKQNILVEPAARNTAPAIAYAALHVEALDPKAVMAILPSDHHVSKPAEFRRVLGEAAELAVQGHLVTLGIKPSRPETGYGYIRVGAPLSGESRAVEAFVEKPDHETARRYLQSGDYLWNGGIFVFTAEAILAALHEHMPDLRTSLKTLRAAMGKRTFPGVLAKVFPKMPATSIDYGVMEKAKNIAVLPGDFGWSDVGSFAAVQEVREADDRGNVIVGKNTVVVDCEGCIVLGDERALAVVGMSGMVVVDSGDAVLVVPKDKSQDVRKVVDALKARRLERFL
jgi:mannose-1-phosphate guanylyltransferase